MRVFLDTEFTDFANPRLISFGLVAEDGREFYAELADGWASEHCVAFVSEVVLPLLDRNSGTILIREEAGAKAIAWLRTLGSSVSIVSDTGVDWRLLSVLLWPHPSDDLNIEGGLLSWPAFAMATRCEKHIEELLSGDTRRHHALVDARALRQAVLQTEAEFIA